MLPTSTYHTIAHSKGCLHLLAGAHLQYCRLEGRAHCADSCPTQPQRSHAKKNESFTASPTIPG